MPRTANLSYLRELDETLLSRTGGAGYYTYGRDRMGSTTALVTTGQTLANTYRYDPWGQSIGTSRTTYNPFQFTGVYLDSATGLYCMTQRFYETASGRFTQLDPLPGSILDVNRYAYAGCNPANFVDPVGLHIASEIQRNYGRLALECRSSIPVQRSGRTICAGVHRCRWPCTAPSMYPCLLTRIMSCPPKSHAYVSPLEREPHRMRGFGRALHVGWYIWTQPHRTR